MPKLRRGPLWTFWDYKFERWPKDKGMRLDHFLLSPKVADRLVDDGCRPMGAWAGKRERPAQTWIMLDLSTRADVPAREYSPIEQACVILSSSKHKEITREFLSFFKTPAVADLLRSYGFEVQSASTN